jgi:hypothetical protein
MMRYAMNSSINDESILTAIQKKYTNITLGDNHRHFQINNWKLIINKVIELDEDTAIMINKLYHYYEILLEFNGWASEMNTVKLESFDSYLDDYKALKEHLK